MHVLEARSAINQQDDSNSSLSHKQQQRFFLILENIIEFSFFIRVANFHGNYQYCLMLCLFFIRSVLFIFSDNFAEKSRIMNHS